MNQIKNRIQKAFTIIPNGLIEDNTISDRGRFLFVYMASKHSKWTFHNKQLCNALSYSEDTLRKYMLELERKGWLTRHLRIRTQGKFTSNIYVIHERPNNVFFDKASNRKKTNTEKTITEKNLHGIFTKHNNTNYKQKENQKNNNFKSSKKNKISLKPKVV